MRNVTTFLICLAAVSCSPQSHVSPVANVSYEALWGHPQPAPGVSPRVSAPVPAAHYAGPALWSVTSGAATVYLFGTMHIPMGDTPWLTPTIAAALNNSSQVWTEADIDAGTQFARAFAQRAYNSQQDLSAMLPAASWSTLSTALHQCGIPPDRAKHMRAWAINFLFAACAAQHTSPGRPAGTAATTAVPDLYIVHAAQIAHIPVYHFELAEQQIAAFADVPDAVQFRTLTSMISRLASLNSTASDAMKQQAGLAAMNGPLQARYWAQGDTVRLAAQINAMRTNPEQAALYNTLFAVRNKRFARGIIGVLHEPVTSFVAIGAGHFTAAGGVISILQSEGYTVTRLE